MSIVLDGTSGITTPDLESAGPISGTTGTFSGAVQASGVATNLYPLVLATAVASTSGTSIDFTGIPSWAKRITVMFSGVSTSGTSYKLIQLGDSGGVETTGYFSLSSYVTTASAADAEQSTAGFILNSNAAVDILYGAVVFTLISGNTWLAQGSLAVDGGTDSIVNVSGNKAVSDTLTQVRITTVNGTDTFDAGTINIMYEG